ncbi:serine hydrolase domain-containing protein [Kytococcus sp. Marseille-QA3725]
MTSALSRRQFAGLATATAATTALGATTGVTASNAALATGPNAEALKAALKGMIGNPLVGAVCSVSGRYGRLDLAAGRFSMTRSELARANARARISSMTKPQLATAVFQLIERKKWTLKTTIDDVLPGLWKGRGSVTVGQLLNHTSGMPDHINDVVAEHDFTLGWWEDFTNDQWSHADIIAAAKKLPWKFTPGEGWAYSNTGYVVLSMMLEKVHGTSIASILRQQVYTKMGMNQTFLFNSAKVENPALELEDVAMLGKQKERLQDVNLSIFSGSAAAMSTSADITDFWAVLLRHQILSQTSVDQMITPVGAAADAGYGYGVLVLDDVFTGKGKLYGHDGGGFGSTAMSFSSRDGWRRMAFMMTGRPMDEEGATRLQNGQFEVMDACMAVSTNRSGRPSGYSASAVRGEVLPMLSRSKFRLG